MNKFARSITKWTKACDKRLSRLISHIHHTCDYKLYCYVGDTAKQCRLGLSQDSDFAGDLEDSKSTSGATLFFGKSYICSSKLDGQETNYSFTQCNRIRNHFLDARLRLDGIPALDLWDLIVAVLGNTTQNHDRTVRPVVCPHANHGRQQSRRVINDLDNVDLAPSNVQSKQWSRWP